MWAGGYWTRETGMRKKISTTGCFIKRVLYSFSLIDDTYLVWLVDSVANRTFVMAAKYVLFENED